MSKLTLQDYQSRPISDLFMAVIVKKLSDEESKKCIDAFSPQDKDYNTVKNIENLINSTIADSVNNSELDPSLAEETTELLKNSITFDIEVSFPSIVIKNGNDYIDIEKDEEIDMTTHELKMLEPFSNYYSENEYSFIEMNGEIVLYFDPESFERYIAKVKSCN